MKGKNLFIITTALLLPLSSMQAELLGSDFKFTNGYRRDKFTTCISALGPEGKLIATDNLHAKGICIYQIGAKASFCALGLAARAEIDYGWVHNGKYMETSKAPKQKAQTTTVASIKHGKIRDLSIGGAYFLLNNGLYQLGPSAGYSRNQQSITLGKAKTKDALDPSISQLKYNNRWQGPWIGIDAICCLSSLTIRGSYEYHWAHWRAMWKIEGQDSIAAFSDKRRSKHAHGKVFFVDASYNFCSCFTLGMGFKWQRWTAQKGRELPISDRLAKLFKANREKDKVKHASWGSVAATVDIGYKF